MPPFAADANLLLNELTRFYGNIKTLLETADAILAETNWEPVSNSVITGSNSITTPEQWLARTVHRFYKHDEPPLKDFLLLLSVLLLDPNVPDKTAVPLLTAGFFRYPSDAIIEINSQNFWYARFYLWWDDFITDGSLHTAPSTKWPKWSLPWSEVQLLARPLEQLTNTETLSQQVLEPILAAITQATTV